MTRIRYRGNHLARLWALGLCIAGTAALAEVRTGEEVVIREGEVIPEDLYVFASRVVIAGTVQGDLLAFTSDLKVPGQVDGDLMTFAGETEITGPVKGSVRAGTGNLRIMGPVGEDVLAAAGRIDLGRHAMVGRDLIVGSGNVEVASEIGGDVRSATGRLALNSVVHGDVRTRARELSIGDDAVIGGTLSYGAEKANISRGARIGNVQRVEAPPRHRGPAAVAFFIGWLRWSIGLFALGLLVRVLFPRFTRTVPQTLRGSPWLSLGVGAAVLVGVPAVALVLFVFGALLGGWWIGLIALGMLAAAVALSFPMVGMFVGDWLIARVAKKHVRLIVSLLIGVLLLALIVRVPILGGLVALATILFGLGALAVSGWRLRPAETAPAPAPA